MEIYSAWLIIFYIVGISLGIIKKDLNKITDDIFSFMLLAPFIIHFLTRG